MAYPQFNFGDRIRKVRRDVARMSQNEMAAAIGVSQKVYSAWEAGRSRPTDIVAAAKKIEEFTAVSAGWLLGVETHPPTREPVGDSTDMAQAA
jgi:DNA-binding XRE family transcriptional regulator